MNYNLMAAHGLDLVKGRGGLNPRERGEGMRTQMRRGRKLERQSIVVKGNDCEFIYLADITSNSGCSNGQKFVLKVHFHIEFTNNIAPRLKTL